MPTYNRLREESSLDSRPDILVTTTPPGTTAFISGVPNGVYAKSIQDVLTPGWAKLSADDRLYANNPMLLEEARVSTLSYDGTVSSVSDIDQTVTEWRGNVTRYFSNMTGLFVDELPDRGALDQLIADKQMVARAKLKALANIDKPHFQFGEDIGEIGETIRFIRRPLSSLRKLTAKYKSDVRKRVRSKRNARRRGSGSPLSNSRDIYQTAADTWLEYRFAAAPLVRSAYDAMSALSRKSGKIPDVQVARGREEYVKIQDVDIPRYHSPSLTTTYNINRRHSVTVRAGIRFKQIGGVDDWKRLLGLRLKDHPVTAWQLLPLSFMVDRVSDISSALEAGINLLDPNIEIMSGWVTTKIRMDHSIRMSGMDLEDAVTGVVGNVITVNDGGYEREPWEPSISDVKPGFTPHRLINDVTSTLDLIALISSALKGS